MSAYPSEILEYAKHPQNRGAIVHPTVSHHETNRSCGEQLSIHLAIKDGIIADYGFEWDTSIITTASAAIFGEAILSQPLDAILTMTYSDVKEMLGMDISPKRKLAACFPLLATRNAIHAYLKDGKRDDFSDVLPE